MNMVLRLGSLVAALAFVAAASACGSDGSRRTNATTTTLSSTTTSTHALPTTVASSSTVAPPTTATPVPAMSIAVWPTAASGIRYRDPVAATRAFATEYLHMANVVVGAFAQGDARSGEIVVRTSSRGPLTTVFVRRLGTDGSWWVLDSTTPDIVLTEPVVLARVTSPVTLRGRSTAFEATVNVSIREDNRTTPLAEGYVMGGSNGEFGPFHAVLTFDRPTSRYGAIVLYTISSESGHVSQATVTRVLLSR